MHTLLNDSLEEVEEDWRFLKAAVSIFGKRGVARNIFIEAQPGKRAISQLHPNIFHQSTLAANAVQISHQENAQEHFGIDRRPTRVVVAGLQSLACKSEINVPIDISCVCNSRRCLFLRQMIFGNVVF